MALSTVLGRIGTASCARSARRRGAALSLLAAGVLAMLVACERPRFVVGEGCDLSSECDAPLACVLGRCRRQCERSRDCGAGLRCLVPSGSTLGGGCQIDDERECTLTSECGRADLVCVSGTCSTACREDRDCPPGASCTRDPVMDVVGCFEDQTALCVYDSDCMAPMICDEKQRCRLECLADRDCRAPRRCVANLCELPDAG